jgi:glycogen operon protein
MLCAGDELGHTQSGNNNPYCQDNETTWIQWTNKDADLMAFTAWVISLRRQLLPFRNQWYTGDTDAHGVPDLAWLRSDGKALDGGDWGTTNDVVLGCLIGHPGRAKSPIVMLFNPSDRAQHFLLPPGIWLAVLDSSLADGRPNWQGAGGTLYNLPAQSLTMLVTAGTPLQFDNSLSTTQTTH